MRFNKYSKAAAGFGYIISLRNPRQQVPNLRLDLLRLADRVRHFAAQQLTKAPTGAMQGDFHGAGFHGQAAADLCIVRSGGFPGEEGLHPREEFRFATP